MQLSASERAVLDHAAQRQHVGWFTFHFADERWEWSPEVERMHGYPPGTASPTTALVLSHKHPDDRRHVATTLERVRRHRQAFSTRHRIVDTSGEIHHVIVVADTLAEADGTVVGTRGFYLDVTPGNGHDHPDGRPDAHPDGRRDGAERHDQVSAAVAEIAENRAVIEQAKGMLMVIYGIGSDAAFDLLRWRSQEGNVKLRLLAQQVVHDFLALAQTDAAPARPAYDNLLLTADQRIGPE